MSLYLRGRLPVDIPLVIVGLAVVVAAAMLLPSVYLVIRAAGEGGDLWKVITSSSALNSLLHTVLLAAAVTGGAIAISVPAAWLTTRSDLPFRRLWSVLLTLPLVFPSYVGAFAIVSALGPRGMLQDLLEPLGVQEIPQIYGFAGAWLTLTLFTFPYTLLPVRAAIQGVDRSLEEVSRGLGKSGIATFFRVTLPQLRPAIVAGSLLVALYTLSDFGAVSILRFDALTRIIFLQYTTSLDRGAAASLALLLVGLALVVVVIEGMSRGRSRYYSNVSHRRPELVTLGWWRWPATFFCGSIVALALILPASVILFWLVRGVASGEHLSFVGTAVLNSAGVSALAATAAVAACLPIAFLVARRPSLVSGALEKASYIGYALPGVTIALALVFFTSNYASFIYQTLVILIFAYVILFLPQALGAARSSLLQVNPRTEEAARGLGKSSSSVLARITVPQILPGISAGAALVFLTAMKELPATLLLSPIGFDTLATEIWSASTEAFFARAALPALLLVAVSALPMAFMAVKGRSIG